MCQMMKILKWNCLCWGFNLDYKNILLILSMEFQSQHRQLTEIQRVDLVLWTISNRPPFCWFISLKENVKFTKYISTIIGILDFFYLLSLYFIILNFLFYFPSLGNLNFKFLFFFYLLLRFFLNCELTERFNKTNCNWFSFSQLNPPKKFPLVVVDICICVCSQITFTTMIMMIIVEIDESCDLRWLRAA